MRFATNILLFFSFMILILSRFCFGQVDIAVDTKTGRPVTVVNPMGPFVDINAENVKSAAAALQAIQKYNRESPNPDPRMLEEEQRAKAELLIAVRIKNAYRPPVTSSTIPVDPNESRIRNEVYSQLDAQAIHKIAPNMKIPDLDRLSLADRKKAYYEAYRASGMSMSASREAVERLNLQ